MTQLPKLKDVIQSSILLLINIYFLYFVQVHVNISRCHSNVAPDIGHPALPANLVGEQLIQEVVARLKKYKMLFDMNYMLQQIDHLPEIDS